MISSMIQAYDLRFWFLVLVAIVWGYRTWVALITLKTAPVIKEIPASSCDQSNRPLVSVIIPAKNEEKNIGLCLDDFLVQDYPHLEIIVAQDNSSDKTEDILKSYGSKISYVNVPKTPEGWTGKNSALHNAVFLAKGDWFLFTDADTRHSPHNISSTLQHVKDRNLAFLTLLPKCLAQSFYEYLIQPFAMGLLGLWFPMQKINNPKIPVYFANGQYLLIKRKLYENLKGHQGVQGEFLEDFALMKKAKIQGERVECALGTNVYGTRMYDSLKSIWRGWRRIFLHAYKQNPVILFKKFSSLILFSILPFTVFLSLCVTVRQAPEQDGFLLMFLGVILMVIIGTSWKAYGIVQAKKRYALLHPLSAFFLSMILLDAFWMALLHKKTKWR